jgi:putative Mg2+ transporter-C (MgtC) family protein
MTQQVLDILYPLLAALVAGSVIGLERGLRSEPAGFRTHALVCVAAAAVVLGVLHASRMLNDVSASSRVAQGIVTGIGFVGAGVIVREGVSVRGLTTAASVWAMTAIGVVFGYGQYLEGALGSAMLLVVLMGLRKFDHHLPRADQAHLSVRFTAAQAMTEAELRALLADLQIKADLMQHKLDNGVIEQATQIRAIPSVVGFDIEPIDA